MNGAIIELLRADSRLPTFGLSAALACIAASCSMAVTVVKVPVDKKCQSVGLKGCPQLVDGVIAYVDGDKTLAENKLREGASQNTPENVKLFARYLSEVASAPGVSDYAGPIKEAALFLSGEPVVETARATAVVAVQAAVAAPAPSAPVAIPAGEPAADRYGPALNALSVRVDPARFRTETVTLSQPKEAKPCFVAGEQGVCFPRRQGPLFVTDVAAFSGCPARLFVGAVTPEASAFTLKWAVEATVDGTTGSQLLVNQGELLVVGVLPSPKFDIATSRCSVTWSGFRPRPNPTGEE